MAEHVGEAAYTTYAAQLFGLLAPGGRLLNHQISRRPGPKRGGTSFIEAYVFPDGSCCPGDDGGPARAVGFEVRDVEALREHYALTLREWVRNLEAEWDRAVELIAGAGAGLAALHGRVGAGLRAPTGSASTRCSPCVPVPWASAACPPPGTGWRGPDVALLAVTVIGRDRPGIADTTGRWPVWAPTSRTRR